MSFKYSFNVGRIAVIENVTFFWLVIGDWFLFTYTLYCF